MVEGLRKNEGRGSDEVSCSSRNRCAPLSPASRASDARSNVRRIRPSTASVRSPSSVLTSPGSMPRLKAVCSADARACWFCSVVVVKERFSRRVSAEAKPRVTVERGGTNERRQALKNLGLHSLRQMLLEVVEPREIPDDEVEVDERYWRRLCRGRAVRRGDTVLRSGLPVQCQRWSE
jgi:hypothetical protein